MIITNNKPTHLKAIRKDSEKTANRENPLIWKSKIITSMYVKKVTGIAIEEIQIRFDIEVICVTSITVNNAADNTANGYLDIFIILLVIL